MGLSRIIFVTGTDTGVGKTLLTASLLLHLRQNGLRALAMKPCCCGGRADVDLIQAIQGSDPPASEVNPFYFAEPLAPLVAARRKRSPLEVEDVLRAVKRMRARCDCLIVEGAGGLLTPLGEGFAWADILEGLPGCDVVIVARNKLGTINHTLLTVEALQRRGAKRIGIVLMDQRTQDFSAGFNAATLQALTAPAEVFAVPFLGNNASDPGGLKKTVQKLKKTLARLADPDSFSARSPVGSWKGTGPDRLENEKKDR